MHGWSSFKFVRMRMIKIVDLDKAIEEELIVFDIKDTIIMVGAGVSIMKPTGLPGGKQLTLYCMEKALGSTSSEKIQRVWKAVLDQLPISYGANYECPRLEVLLDNINKNDRLFLQKAHIFLYGFLGFSEQKSNENHYLLAKCVEKGSLVLTVNFDTCIENVWGQVLYTTYRNQYPYVSTENGKGVYHLHGVAMKGETVEYDMGATLESVKNGVDPVFATYLKKELSENKWMIFVGYSGSDFFDWDPFFNSLDTEANAIFFLHGSPGEDEIKKAQKHIGGFRNAYIITGDTTKFLKYISGEGQNVFENVEHNSKNWESYFENIIYDRGVLQEFIRKLNVIRLSNQMGVGIEIVDSEYYEDLNEVIEFISERDITYLFGSQTDMSATAVADVNSTISKLKNTKKQEAKKLEKKMHQLNYQIKNARKNIIAPVVVSGNITLDRLYMLVEKGEISPYNFNSATVYAMNRHAKMWIRKWIRVGHRKEIITELRRIQLGLERMLQLPFYQYMYISYYITLLKLDNLICAILYPEKDNEIRENVMLQLALEINSITQIKKIYMNYCRKELILFRMDGKLSHCKRALAHLRLINKISQISGAEKITIAEILAVK